MQLFFFWAIERANAHIFPGWPTKIFRSGPFWPTFLSKRKTDIVNEKRTKMKMKPNVPNKVIWTIPRRKCWSEKMIQSIFSHELKTKTRNWLKIGKIDLLKRWLQLYNAGLQQKCNSNKCKISQACQVTVSAEDDRHTRFAKCLFFCLSKSDLLIETKCSWIENQSRKLTGVQAKTRGGLSELRLCGQFKTLEADI